MQRVYIMGPMSGRPNLNREAFSIANDKLLLHGYWPINPHHIESPFPRGEPFKQEQMYRQVMPMDVFALSTADAVIALPGWEMSRGSALEAHAADLMGIPIYTYDDDSTEWKGTIEEYISDRIAEMEHDAVNHREHAE